MEQKSQQPAELRVTPEVTAAVVADKCREDDGFAERLHKDAQAALAEINGQPVPHEVKPIVHQNSADHWHIVIPSDAQARRLGEAYKMMDEAGGTLSDEQLQAVSGGFEVWIAALIIGGIAVGTTAIVAGTHAGTGG